MLAIPFSTGLASIGPSWFDDYAFFAHFVRTSILRIVVVLVVVVDVVVVVLACCHCVPHVESMPILDLPAPSGLSLHADLYTTQAHPPKRYTTQS